MFMHAKRSVAKRPMHLCHWASRVTSRLIQLGRPRAFSLPDTCSSLFSPEPNLCLFGGVQELK